MPAVTEDTTTTHTFCLRSKRSSQILQVVIVTPVQAVLFGVDGHVDDGQQHTDSEVAHSDDLPVVPATSAAREGVGVHARLLYPGGRKQSDIHSHDYGAGHCNTSKDSNTRAHMH